MNKSLIYGLFSSLALCSLVSCSDDFRPSDNTKGRIYPSVSLDANPLKRDRASRSATEISVNDLSLKLSSLDGTFSKSWDSVADFNSEEEFKVDNYLMEATYGDASDEGFEKPYYYGAASLSVRENQQTPVAIDVTLANSMVTVQYTDAFKDYFTSYQMLLHSESGNYLEYAADETRPVYVKSGKVTLIADVVKPNGTGGKFEALELNAQPRHHYTVTVDVNGGQVGGAVLEITYDDSISDEVIVDIDLSDDLFNSPAPVVDSEGFDPAQTYSMVDGFSAGLTPKITVIARGGLESLVMTTKSPSLIAQGWPSEIDLVAATSTQQNVMSSLGLGARGVFGNVDKMAWLDLTKVIDNIKYVADAENTNTITVVAKDLNGKLSDIVTLTVVCEPVELSLDITEIADPDENNANVNLTFNGPDVEKNVAIQYKNDRGTWSNVTINSIEPASRGGETYRVNITLPDNASVTLRAVCGSVISESVVLTREILPFRLKVNDYDVYAKRAKVSVTDESGMAVDASGLNIVLSTDGINFTAPTQTVEGSTIKLDGLESGNTYIARLEQNGVYSRKATLTTELEAQIPDSNFENWSSEKKGDYQYLWIVGNGSPWATVNNLTVSTSGSGSGNGLNTKGCAYKATSGTIPANGRSTKSNGYGGTFGTTKAADGHTVGNASINNLGYSGNAALIRTVGYGSGNSAGSGTSNPASGFNTCQNVASGELYLGTYSNGANYSGYDFASRPTAISFYYKYVPYGSVGDYGDCEVKLLDASGNVIATAKYKFEKLDDEYTQKVLNLEYTTNNAKAAKIMIRFKSSANPSLASSTSWLYGPGNKNVSGGEYVGSELYIDEITLQY